MRLKKCSSHKSLQTVSDMVATYVNRSTVNCFRETSGRALPASHGRRVAVDVYLVAMAIDKPFRLCLPAFSVYWCISAQLMPVG